MTAVAGKTASKPSTGTAGSATQAGRHARAAVIQEIWDWDSLAMFHTPVTDEVVPGYSAVIDKPIDLTTIRERNAAGAYDGDNDGKQSTFVDDVMLMVSNALVFNGKGTPWHRHAKSLQKKLRGIFARHGVKQNDDDETYMPTHAAVDSDASIVRDEKRHGAEDIAGTLSAMQADMQLTREQLLAKYRGAAAASSAKAFEAALGADVADDDEQPESIDESDSDDEEEEEEAFEDSGSSLESGSSSGAEDA